MVWRRVVVASAAESAYKYDQTGWISLPLDSRNPVRLVHGCDNVASDIVVYAKLDRDLTVESWQ
jgi:hypothetical protein